MNAIKEQKQNSQAKCWEIRVADAQALMKEYESQRASALQSRQIRLIKKLIREASDQAQTHIDLLNLLEKLGHSENLFTKKYFIEDEMVFASKLLNILTGGKNEPAYAPNSKIIKNGLAFLGLYLLCLIPLFISLLIFILEVTVGLHISLEASFWFLLAFILYSPIGLMLNYELRPIPYTQLPLSGKVWSNSDKSRNLNQFILMENLKSQNLSLESPIFQKALSLVGRILPNTEEILKKSKDNFHVDKWKIVITKNTLIPLFTSLLASSKSKPPLQMEVLEKIDILCTHPHPSQLKIEFLELLKFFQGFCKKDVALFNDFLTDLIGLRDNPDQAYDWQGLVKLFNSYGSQLDASKWPCYLETYQMASRATSMDEKIGHFKLSLNILSILQELNISLESEQFQQILNSGHTSLLFLAFQRLATGHFSQQKIIPLQDLALGILQNPSNCLSYLNEQEKIIIHAQIKMEKPPSSSLSQPFYSTTPVPHSIKPQPKKLKEEVYSP